MSNKVWHILGNGDRAGVFEQNKDKKGKILLCNMPPFHIDPKKVYATCMVDFKMMAALTQGTIAINEYMWVLGTRPRIWMYDRPQFHLKYAPNVKEFYTHVPNYAINPTNFNCGHMAAHYAANRHQADEIHLYGFDTIFDFNMNSVTDFYLSSDRTDGNNYRLLNIWRPIWRDIFREFSNTKFVLHHNHDALKIPKLDNMEIVVYDMPLNKIQKRQDYSDISDGRGMDQQKIDPSISVEMTPKQKKLAKYVSKTGLVDGVTI